MKERLIYSCLAPRSLPRQLKAMSFLRDVEGFSVDRLKSVRTRITTFEGRKVKVKLHILSSVIPGQPGQVKECEAIFLWPVTAISGQVHGEGSDMSAIKVFC